MRQRIRGACFIALLWLLGINDRLGCTPWINDLILTGMNRCIRVQRWQDTSREDHQSSNNEYRGPPNAWDYDVVGKQPW